MRLNAQRRIVPYHRRLLVLVGLIAVVWLSLGCAVLEEGAADRHSIATASGQLRGVASPLAETVTVFRGVPFAAPPVNERRFRPPQPPASWEGVRDADQFGTACWQDLTPEDSLYSRGMDLERSEDCLYLNVWSDTAGTDQPVMVWFHGGAHTTGHGSSAIFDGTTLASKGAVVVSPNYRLGAFGFLAHPSLTAESVDDSSGNYGLLDKVRALEWVRDNIAAFGGDAGNVTIFGQSAGSQSVCALMATPLSEDLFHRVIGQSGSCLGDLLPLSEVGDSAASTASSAGSSGHAIGLAFAEQLGAGSVADLRAATAEEILEATVQVPGGVRQFVLDGWVFERQVKATFERGLQHQVPVLTGTTADEGTALFETLSDVDVEGLLQFISSRFDGGPGAILDLYQEALDISPKRAMQAILADQLFAVGARAWVQFSASVGQPAYLYSFERAVPTFRLYLPDRPDLGPSEERGFGAYHSGDLAYTFGNTRNLGIHWEDWDHEIADYMSSYWVNFARSGDPNGEGLPNWPRYEANSDQALLIGPAEITTVAGFKKAKVERLRR